MKKRKRSLDAKRVRLMYMVALILAVLNDILDLAGIAPPLLPLETILDFVIAFMIIRSLPQPKLMDLLVTAADAIIGPDILPLWSMYVLYRMRKEPVLAKLAPTKLLPKEVPKEGGEESETKRSLEPS